MDGLSRYLRAILCSGLAKGKINGTGHSTSVKPAICVNTNSLACEFLEIARLLN